MKYVLTVASIDGSSVTMTTSMGYAQVMNVGDSISVELPDNATVQEVTQFPEVSYEHVKKAAQYYAHQAQDGHVDE